MGYAEILMSTAPDICADAAANTTRANQTTVDILLADNTGSAVVPPAMPGTYSVGGMPSRAVLIVRTFDAQCQVVSTSMHSATSGTVDLTRISGATFTGTFDVILDTQDHLTGSFEPEECPSLAQVGSAATCM